VVSFLELFQPKCFVSSILITWPTHLIPFCVTLKILCDQYKLWSSSLCNFLSALVNLIFLRPRYVSQHLFLNFVNFWSFLWWEITFDIIIQQSGNPRHNRKVHVIWSMMLLLIAFHSHTISNLPVYSLSYYTSAYFRFDIIFNTEGSVAYEPFLKFCKPGGFVVTTGTSRIASDTYGLFFGSIYAFWIRIRCLIKVNMFKNCII
jgi:hypothetical protein